MQLTRRDDLGRYLNEAGLTGAGVEVGAGAGEFARQVLGEWAGRELTLVDAWEPQPRDVYADVANADPAGHAARYDRTAALAAADPRVRLAKAPSPAAACRFPDGSLDFVYVDANHAYLTVRDDLRHWYPKVRPGGLLAGHDYLDGVVGLPVRGPVRGRRVRPGGRAGGRVQHRRRAVRQLVPPEADRARPPPRPDHRGHRVRPGVRPGRGRHPGEQAGLL